MGAPGKIVDICIGLAIVYAGVWIYELGNVLALSSAGAQATISFVGILPVGVSAVTSGQQLLTLVKTLQVILCSGVMLMMFLAIRSRGLPFSAIVASALLSVYLASSYWEVLSLIGPTSYWTHMGIFTSLALATQLGLSRFSKT